MDLKQKVRSADGKDTAIPGDLKKRRRVGFAEIDKGFVPNDCIKIYLVNSEGDVGSTCSLCIDPVDLHQYFGQDGKIYGYKDLKINVWISTLSFHAYADISFDSTYDGGKGITDLKAALDSIFGESLVEKEIFLQTFSKDSDFISKVIADSTIVHSSPHLTEHKDSDAEGPTEEVFRIGLETCTAGLLYHRLSPLLRLLLEVATPIDTTDSKWEIYLVAKRITNLPDSKVKLLGFATVYRFYHYPCSTRLRVSQVMIFPPYQRQGHCHRLLEAIYFVSLSENIYDVTIEEPSDYLQCMRTSIDASRLRGFEPVKLAVGYLVANLKELNASKRTCRVSISPPASLVEITRQKLKITKKQFLRCWEVLIYLSLDPKDPRSMENFRECISDRVKGDIVLDNDTSKGKQLVEVSNNYNSDMSFVVFCTSHGAECEKVNHMLGTDPRTQEEQLNQLVEKQLEEIKEVSSVCLRNNADKMS